LGHELPQTREELGLEYEVAAVVHKSGRVTVNLTVAGQGRLEPLESIQLAIPSQDGTGFFDLVVSLATTKVDGKLLARAHLSRELAERASISLITWSLDGKKTDRTRYSHSIALSRYLKEKK